MSHGVGVPRLPDPPAQWDPRFMQEFSRTLDGWMRRMTTETVQEAGAIATQEVTANTSVGPADGLVLVDTTSGGVVITLPDAATVVGREFTVKRISADSNTVRVTSVSGALDDAASAFLVDQMSSMTWKSDGTNYWLIAQVSGNSMMIAPAVGGLTLTGIAPTMS